MQNAMMDMLVSLLPYGIVAFLGLIMAVLGGVLLATGRKVNPGLVVGGVGLAALGGSMSAMWALPASGAAEGAFEAVQLATMTRFSGWFAFSAVGAISLLVFAIAGAKSAPRDLKAAGVAGAAVAIVVILTAVSGVVNGESGAGIFFYARAVEYAVLGSLVGLAMLSGGAPDEPGREAGAAAALTFALLVAVCETAGRAATTFFLVISVGGTELEHRAANIQGYQALTDPEIPWMLATIGAAALVGVIGVANAARDGNHAAWAGLVWLWLIPLIWLAGAPSTELLIEVAEALP